MFKDDRFKPSYREWGQITRYQKRVSVGIEVTKDGKQFVHMEGCYYSQNHIG